MPQLVLFDLDGTLADTAPDILNAVNRTLAEAGCPPLALATVRGLVSRGARVLLDAGFPEPPEEADMDRLLGRLFAIYGETPAQETTVFPGLAELIAELGDAGIRWGVVTNKPVALAAPIVAALGLSPAPVCVIGGDSYARKKPDPLPLLEACRIAGVTPEKTVYVGDAEIDVRAARAAGMPCVVAGFGYAPEYEAVCAWDAEHYAASVGELAQILGAPQNTAATA
ncbi:MAG: phosphoglycolate phosphatase [Gammaproteobacteria bacterium]